MYTNTKENEKRYQDIKAQYQAAANKRKVKIQLARANVEAAEATIKEIEQEWTELMNNRPQRWTREMTQYKEGIISRRDAARRRLEQKRVELATALRVGEENTND